MVKELQTRISLKYASYSDWTKWYLATNPNTPTSAPDFTVANFNFDQYANKGANLKLNRGEIALCAVEVSDNQATTAPTVLFKVGDGEHRFCELKWASAKAADVYNWAKAETVALNDTNLVFKASDGTPLHTIDLSSLTASADEKIADIETALNDGSDGTKGIISKVAMLLGSDETEGSVAKALKDAKGYTDTREAAIEEAYKDYTDQAKTAANTYTDGVVKALSDGAVANNAAAIAAHTTATNPHGITKTTVGLGNVDNKSVATIKTEFTGEIESGNTNFATGGDVYTAIEAAKTAAANTAQGKVDALANGAVATNTSDITALKTTVGNHTSSINKLIGSDVNMSVRAIAAEETAKIVDNAPENYNTLKEIADFITGDKTGAAGMANDISTLKIDVGDIKESIETINGDIEALEANNRNLYDVIGDYDATNTVEAAVKAAKTQADKGVADAKNAQDKANEAYTYADNLNTDITGLKDALNDEETGLINRVDTNVAAIEALEEVAINGDNSNTNLRQAITSIENIVTKGDNTNAQLRNDINDLKEIVVDGDNSNSALAGEISRVAGLVDDYSTGLGKTYEIASANQGDITAIKANYVSYKKTNNINYLMAGEDIIIFNCGGANDVI